MSSARRAQRLPAPAVPAQTGGTRLLQRKCACGSPAGVGGACAECARHDRVLHRRSVRGGRSLAALGLVEDVLRTSGQPLDGATASAMTARLGHDFSKVRVHTDARAAASASAISALAYTVGSDVVFGAGQYAPGTGAGSRLLAHELTHVIQQGAPGAPASGPLRIADDDSAGEQQARSIEQGASLENPAAASGLVQRSGKSSEASPCGGAWTCASSRECEQPDNPAPARPDSTSWALTVMVDIDVPTAAEVDSEHVGHTYVKFEESNGNIYTYGFYPNPIDMPTLMKEEVLGCMVHPDSKHEPCTDYKESFTLTKEEYAKALDTAQVLCKGRPRYDVRNYNCTSFAGMVARDAGKSLPEMRGEVSSYSITADNPNTLYENLKKRDAAAQQGAAP